MPEHYFHICIISNILWTDDYNLVFTETLASEEIKYSNFTTVSKIIIILTRFEMKCICKPVFTETTNQNRSLRI